MIKKIFAGLFVFVSAAAFSQENNASPYSYYGIGDQKFRGSVENRAMGGLGAIADSVHLNLQNPATYNTLRQTTYTVAGSNTATTFKNSTAEEKAGRTTLDYLAVGLPFKKIGVAFGLMPYTAVGYRIQNTVTGEDGLIRRQQFNGSGGLNRVFGGVSYNLFKGFSIGADFQYNFGNIETKSIVGLPDSDVQYPARETNKTHYDGVSFNLGAMYTAKIGNKLSWFGSLTYAPESTLNASTERQTATITFNGDDEIVINSINVTVPDEDVKMPSRTTFGTGIGESRKWYAGAEYSFQEQFKLSNRFDNVTQNAGFESSYRVSVGGYYIPNFASFNSYFERMTYRAGFRYEKTGLVFNNESINDMGISLGLGFPLTNFAGSSNLNVGVEFGKRGTTNAGLIQENYMSLFVSLSFNDRWFLKRKYD